MERVVNMEQKRMIKMMRILSQTNEPMTGPQLSEKLGITVRTLRNDLKEYKKELGKFLLKKKTK